MPTDEELEWGTKLQDYMIGFRRAAQDDDIPYDFFISFLTLELILGYVQCGLGNKEFIETLEEAWYKTAPGFSKKLEEMERNEN